MGGPETIPAGFDPVEELNATLPQSDAAAAEAVAAEAAADKVKRSRLLPGRLKAFAAFTFAAALVGLIVVWGRRVEDAQQTALWFELSKVLMQVMGVVVLGAIFSAWVSGLTLEHQREESDLARAHSDWQRDVEMKKDTRQREDDLRRELLEATIKQYGDVKRARRRLRAARYTGSPWTTSVPPRLMSPGSPVALSWTSSSTRNWNSSGLSDCAVGPTQRTPRNSMTVTRLAAIT